MSIHTSIPSSSCQILILSAKDYKQVKFRETTQKYIDSLEPQKASAVLSWNK